VSAAATIPSILIAEPLALDLVNTRMYLADSWVDLLDSDEERGLWLTALNLRLGIDTSDAAAFTDVAANALKTVREHAAAAIEPARQGKQPPPRALSGLNKAMRAAPATPQARWDGNSVTADTHRNGSLAARLAATFAEATVQLLTEPDIRKVRRCDAPACVMLFLPRNPNRRWCTPSICGNRARVARYYLRHKRY
jgi:predicted RNA-binding Zn ribbon-like protein